MKVQEAAHFNQVKLHNEKMIRNLLRKKSPMSIAQIGHLAGLSYPTVAALLKELMEKGEVLISSEVESIGGRPGSRYELNAEYQYALVLYFHQWELTGGLYDPYGTLKARYTFPVSANITREEITDFVKTVKEEYKALSMVSLGIPGAVYDTEITYLPKFVNLEGDGLAQRMNEELGVKVLIENDANATAFAEAEEKRDFAHIVYVQEDQCIGVGIVLGGEIMRGCHGFAGEMEYLCDNLESPEDTFVTSILTLTCVLNLPEVLITGPFCNAEFVKRLVWKLEKRVPAARIPKIQVINDAKEKYEYGLFLKVLRRWEETI